jgi:hypothetical protein
LQLYCNYQQNDWADLLSLTEFTYNNAYQDLIDALSFFANYGYHPQFNLDVHGRTTPSVSISMKECATQLRELQDQLVEAVKQAQNDQVQYYDVKYKAVEFNVGDKVWLSTLNVRSERQSKKLDWKKMGLYCISTRIGMQVYRLELPSSLRIHPTFHVLLLEPHQENTLSGRIAPPPPVIVGGHGEYEVEEVLDAKCSRNRLFFLVKWKIIRSPTIRGNLHRICSIRRN